MAKTGGEVSAIAARLMKVDCNDLFNMDANELMSFAEEVRKLAASALRQDKQKGKQS